jgi:glucose-6-phosphate isomerase
VKDINYTSNFDPIPLDDAAAKKVAAVREAIKVALHDEQYTTLYSSVYLPYDSAMHRAVDQRAIEVGIIDLCVVIGIGGSSLGFRAVYDALQDQARVQPQNVIVLETVDTPSVKVALARIEEVLIQHKRIHVSVISKSGTTTETIALFRVVQPLLQKHNPQSWHKQVTIITDTGSPLEQYAQEHKITVLHIPPLVGGRYSVFSPAGLFPLMLCGIDLDNLVTGAREAVEDMIKNTPTGNFPYLYGSLFRVAHTHTFPVHDTFIFSNWCATIGLWHRQLVAESLGKKQTTGDKVVTIVPTVSVGSTDLHSIGQLYLSGARGFITTFLIMQEHDDIKTNTDHSLDRCVVSLNDRSLAEIMDIIFEATLKAYQERPNPCSVIALPERSPKMIGNLLQSYMLAIMYAGALLDVNPFDQPDVERYKTITRTLLQQQ